MFPKSKVAALTQHQQHSNLQFNKLERKTCCACYQYYPPYETLISANLKQYTLSAVYHSPSTLSISGTIWV